MYYKLGHSLRLTGQLEGAQVYERIPADLRWQGAWKCLMLIDSLSDARNGAHLPGETRLPEAASIEPGALGDEDWPTGISSHRGRSTV
jgi:hypothetical protein